MSYAELITLKNVNIRFSVLVNQHINVVASAMKRVLIKLGHVTYINKLSNDELVELLIFMNNDEGIDTEGIKFHYDIIDDLPTYTWCKTTKGRLNSLGLI
jgi:hypothetical protein